MSCDLITRLRDMAWYEEVDVAVANEAADEIERLRQALELVLSKLNPMPLSKLEPDQAMAKLCRAYRTVVSQLAALGCLPEMETAMTPGRRSVTAEEVRVWFDKMRRILEDRRCV